MKQKIKAPEFEVLSFLPKDFFNKDINEEFTKLVMSSFFLRENGSKEMLIEKNLIIFTTGFLLNLH